MRSIKLIGAFLALSFLTLLLVRSPSPQGLLQAALHVSPSPSEEEPEATSIDEAASIDAEENEEEALDAFQIPFEGLEVEENQVRRHETFADLVTSHGVPYEKMLSMAEAAEPVLDVRRLRAGKPYRVYKDQEQARYFVYQRDPERYVVFDLSDSVQVYAGERPVAVQKKTASGVIERSLYETLAGADLDLELAFKLSEVFAWQIDFFRIRKGDRFEVVYEERQIDGEPVGLGKILAARFQHRGEDFYGFYFEQDGRGEYFDENGESLRKQLLKAPLRYRRISSRYTKRRYHPVQKRYKAHLGTDYAASTGTPVRSVGDGKVMEAGYKQYNGNWVKIRHNTKYTTGYLHLSRIAKGIRPGTEVEQGQVIGYVGATGLATGPHLCYRFWKNGRQVDPLKEEMPPSEPVAAENRLAFNRAKDALMPLLQPEEEGSFIADAEDPSPALELLISPLPLRPALH